MEHIHSKNANQLAKQLQDYKKYQGKTQKEIKNKIGNTNNLRIELQRLQDKRNVRSSKKQPNYIIPNDISKEIMLKTDIDTLQNYCQTNKEFNKLCHSLDFFNEKLVGEGSIPIIFDDIRSMDNLEHIVKECGQMFNTNNIYIILYRLIKLAEHDAKMILLVNQIEKERKYLSSFGSMSIELGGQKLAHYYVIYNIIKPDLIHQFDNVDKATYNTITIEYDDGTYKLIYNLFTNDENDEDEEKEYDIEIRKNDAINILTLFLFDKYTSINEDLHIYGRRDVEFWYDTDLQFGHSKEYYDKQNIYETLYQLEKQGLLKI